MSRHVAQIVVILSSLLASSQLHCCHGFAILSTNVIRSSRDTRFIPTIRREGNLTSERWENKFNELVKFKHKFGHVNVPQLPNKDIPEDYRELGTFCRNVRSMYKYLSDPSKAHLSFLDEDRIERLESIGFVWNSHEANWSRRYKELESFHKRFGHCNVPKGWKENPGLDSWIVMQRKRYRAHTSGDDARRGSRKFSQREIRLMESIGFEWDPRNTRWWGNWDDLKAFHEEHGHFNVSKQCDDKNQGLVSYVGYLRRCCREYVLSYSIIGSCERIRVSGLDSARLEVLRQAEFCWLPDPNKPYQDPPDDIFANQ